MQVAAFKLLAKLLARAWLSNKATLEFHSFATCNQLKIKKWRWTYLSSRNGARSRRLWIRSLRSIHLRRSSSFGFGVCPNSFCLAFVAPSPCFRLRISYVQSLRNQGWAFVLLLYSAMVSAPETQGNRSTRGRGCPPWACPLSARGTIATPSASTSVSDWLFFLGRCVFLLIKLSPQDGAREGSFLKRMCTYLYDKKVLGFFPKLQAPPFTKIHYQHSKQEKKNPKKPNLLYKCLAKLPLRTINPINV